MDGSRKKRSLIMAGGGLKVAYQAGALQVWLDEAGLRFDHVDGASGGVLNLAMYCQGMSGSQIAESWRRYPPGEAFQLDGSLFTRLFYAQSLARLDSFRENVLRKTWALDWNAIRSSAVEATFNVYKFSGHELLTLEPAQMTEDLLVAAVSLPMWFPPVVIGGQRYLDAVYLTDANLEEAIRRGADEIWVIWTVSDKDEWHDGFVAQYFQIIEIAANGHFKRICRRIEANNRALAAGERGEFGRPIALKVLKADVPLHYLVDFSQDRVIETVNRGVADARQWCRREGIPLRPGLESYPSEAHGAHTRLRFSEQMRGYVAPGSAPYQTGFDQGQEAGSLLTLRLTIDVDGVNRFVTRPEHEASAAGTVDAALFGGARPVEKGVFNLLVDQAEPGHKHMLYRLFFRDAQGQPLTLSGFKDVRDDPGRDLWSDTTTLFVRILRGHVPPGEEERAAIAATGIIRIHLLDFLAQLTTFRTEGPTFADRAAALARFGRLFLGKLWDVYARDVLVSGPL